LASEKVGKLSMKSTMKAFLIATALALLAVSPVRANTFTYDVDYSINGTIVTGDIVLNCDSCDVTSSTLVSWSLSLAGSGTSATFTGADLFASPTGITFTPTASTDTIFNGSAGGLFFGSATIVGGGSGCTPGHPGCDLSGNGNPCAVVQGAGNYGHCLFGALTIASTETSLVITTGVTESIPGPIAGAGIPGLIVAGGGLLLWYRRKQTASDALAAA
jgi:LPXTG-motif cell wall-anchored protein